MFCPEGKVFCNNGNINLNGITDKCMYWKDECLDFSYKLDLIERTKNLTNNLTDQHAMEKVVYEILFEDIENSDAPEQVKEYIRKYRTDKLINSVND